MVEDFCHLLVLLVVRKVKAIVVSHKVTENVFYHMATEIVVFRVWHTVRAIFVEVVVDRAIAIVHRGIHQMVDLRLRVQLHPIVSGSHESVIQDQHEQSPQSLSTPDHQASLPRS